MSLERGTPATDNQTGGKPPRRAFEKNPRMDGIGEFGRPRSGNGKRNERTGKPRSRDSENFVRKPRSYHRSENRPHHLVNSAGTRKYDDRHRDESDKNTRADGPGLHDDGSVRPDSERHGRRPDSRHRRQLPGQAEPRTTRLGQRRNRKPLRRYAVQTENPRFFGTGRPLTRSNATKRMCAESGVCRHERTKKTESASQTGLSVFHDR